MIKQFMEPLPIAQADKSDARRIGALVEALSAEDCSKCPELEAELNDRVAALYGLTPDERKIIEQGGS